MRLLQDAGICTDTRRSSATSRGTLKDSRVNLPNSASTSTLTESHQNCDCYVAVSEILKIETQEVYVPSDFIWGEKGYVFVPGGAKERPADGSPARYELTFTKVTVELMLHGRAKFEVVTEVTESSIRIYRVYEQL